MSYKVVTTSPFERDFKRLAKKYPSLQADFECLVNDLEQNPLIGSDLGGRVRKIRMAIASKNQGKRGGARVLTYNILVNDSSGTVYAFAIYDKSEKADIPPKEREAILKNLGLGIVQTG